MVKANDDAVRGGVPARAGAVLLPKHLALPPRLRKLYVAGCQAAAAGQVENSVNTVDGVPPSQVVERDQAEARRKALLSAVPPARKLCLEKGLDALDPADQHPGELLDWLNNPEARTLILAGPPGSGKTMAGYATLAHAATHGAAMQSGRRHGVRPVMVRAWEVNAYVVALRPDGDEQPAWKLRDRAHQCELLLADDLGAELDNEEMTVHMRDEIARLLTYRLEHNLRTIITTNRRGPELQRMTGGRLWSRLNERSEAITFVGEDRRMLTALEW